MWNIRHLSFLSNEDLKKILFELSRFSMARNEVSIFEYNFVQQNNISDDKEFERKEFEGIPRLEFLKEKLTEEECLHIDTEINKLEELVQLMKTCIENRSGDGKKYISADYINFLRWHYQEICVYWQDLNFFGRQPVKLSSIIKNWNELYQQYVNRCVDEDFKTLLGAELDNNVRLAMTYSGNSSERKFKLLEIAIARLDNITTKIQENNWIECFKINKKRLTEYRLSLRDAVDAINSVDMIHDEVFSKGNFEKSLKHIEQAIDNMGRLAAFDKELDEIQRNLMGIYIKAHNVDFSEQLLKKIIEGIENELDKWQKKIKENSGSQNRAQEKINAINNDRFVGIGRRLVAFVKKYPATATIAIAGTVFAIIQGKNSEIVERMIHYYTGDLARSMPSVLTGAAIGTVGTAVTIGGYALLKDREIKLLNAKNEQLEGQNKSLNINISKAQTQLEANKNGLDAVENEKSALETKKREIDKKIQQLWCEYQMQKTEELRLWRRRKKIENSEMAFSNNNENSVDAEYAKQKVELKKSYLDKKLHLLKQQKQKTRAELNFAKQKINELTSKEHLCEKKLDIMYAKALETVGGVVHSNARNFSNYQQVVNVMQEIKNIDADRQACSKEKHAAEELLSNLAIECASKIEEITDRLDYAIAMDVPLEWRDMQKKIDALTALLRQSTHTRLPCATNESVQSSVSTMDSLSSIGLDYQEISENGHCLYQAVFFYLNQGEDQAWLRRIVAAHIETNLEEFSAFIQPPAGKTIENYINDIRNGKEWADNIELEVLMRVLGRPIVVIGPDGKLRNHDEGLLQRFNGEPIFVYYNGHTHYDALIRNNAITAQQIIKKLTQLNERSPTNVLLKPAKEIANEKLQTNVPLSLAKNMQSAGSPINTRPFSKEEQLRQALNRALEEQRNCLLNYTMTENKILISVAQGQQLTPQAVKNILESIGDTLHKVLNNSDWLKNIKIMDNILVIKIDSVQRIPIFIQLLQSAGLALTNIVSASQPINQLNI